jgi:cobalamin biosynthesis Co2+ chelatase CbiK
MQTQMEMLGYRNVFICTFEGDRKRLPARRSIERLPKPVTKQGASSADGRCRDHANNDMAGEDEDSWLSMFQASGKFENIETQISGLGRIADIQALYVAHTKAAVDSVAG